MQPEDNMQPEGDSLRTTCKKRQKPEDDSSQRRPEDDISLRTTPRRQTFAYDAASPSPMPSPIPAPVLCSLMQHT